LQPLAAGLGKNLAQAGKAGQGFGRLHAGSTLDEGQGIIHESHLHVVAGGVDPLARNLALEVSHAGQGQELHLALVVAFLIGGALESGHLVGVAGHCGLHGGLTGEVSLVSIGGGAQVRCAALQQGGLDGADLGAGDAAAHDFCQLVGQTAQLGVAEAVVAVGLGFGDEVAVLVVDAFGNHHEALAGGVVNLLHVGQEVVHVEINLGEVDEVGTCASVGGQGGSGGQPAGVTAHHLDDGHHAGVVAAGIVLHLHHGSGDVLGGRGVAGAVVSAEKVVVDGLRNAHHAAFPAALLHELGNLVAGVHGVVATVVEEVAHVELLEGLQQLLVVGRIHIRVLHLVAAGAQGRGGSELQQLQLHRVFHTHVVKLTFQHALDAVGGTQHAGNLRSVESGLDSTQNAGVNHSGRTAGLTDDACTFEFVHDMKNV